MIKLLRKGLKVLKEERVFIKIITHEKLQELIKNKEVTGDSTGYRHIKQKTILFSNNMITNLGKTIYNAEKVNTMTFYANGYFFSLWQIEEFGPPFIYMLEKLNACLD